MSKMKAWLKPNLLTKGDTTDFIAVPVTVGSISTQDIIQRLKEEGMEIRTETAQDIISRFNRKVAEMVLEGYNVNTGLVYMRPTIRGVFRDKTWNPEIHNVQISITQGAELRKEVTQTLVEILGVQADPMTILSITDSATKKTDGSITKGKNVEIKGAYLKIAGNSPTNGIYLRNIDTNRETKLPEEDIVLNEPSRLLILIPADLESGSYELSIVTQFSQGKSLLKEPRKTVFEGTITVS
ncbi:DNA-binding domain-containing protein [Capnocytophaga stomatis]|uniref:DNA-binding domain-containing protein n=1 Tax=Capnocytophaga stomatis TaxID=1848904 RepID=A0ABW8Q8T8_9FLAO